MSELLKIKLTIADRVYPLSVAPDQEEALRKSAKKIDAMIKLFSTFARIPNSNFFGNPSSVLEPFGYYAFDYFDDERWPHFKLIEKLPPLKPGEQSILMKEAVVHYFIQKGLIQ